jgi:hypothetical protein
VREREIDREERERERERERRFHKAIMLEVINFFFGEFNYQDFQPVTFMNTFAEYIFLAIDKKLTVLRLGLHELWLMLGQDYDL